jgi:hypothetical protein
MYKFNEIIKQPGGYLVRVFQGIDGFRGKYGIWPTKLRLGETAYEGLAWHLTEFGFELLKSKIAIEVVKNNFDHISACDDLGHDLIYGWYEEKPDINTYQWLDVETITQFSSEKDPEANSEKTKKVYHLLGVDGKIYESFLPGKFGGYKLKKIYGRLDCSSANAALKKGGYTKHRVFFANEVDAILAGYRPCGKCMKDFFKIWKKGGQPGTNEYPWLCTPKIN